MPLQDHKMASVFPDLTPSHSTIGGRESISSTEFHGGDGLLSIRRPQELAVMYLALSFLPLTPEPVIMAHWLKPLSWG